MEKGIILKESVSKCSTIIKINLILYIDIKNRKKIKLVQVSYVNICMDVLLFELVKDKISIENFFLKSFNPFPKR